MKLSQLRHPPHSAELMREGFMRKVDDPILVEVAYQIFQVHSRSSLSPCWMRAGGMQATLLFAV
jgi:hypothetical protein